MSYKTTKICSLFLFCLLALPFLNSCEDSSEDLIGNWKELSSFDGNARTDAVGFAIGSKGYVGTGYDGEDRLNDFWEYDPRRDTWTQLPPLQDKDGVLAVVRNRAIGFGTDTKGYIGTGYDGTNKLKDFYEYDPATNKWDRKKDFGGSARYSAVAMAINNKGYVGTGYDDNYLKDFWKYNPDDDSWTQVTSYGGSKRLNAASFVIDGKGYVVTGTGSGGDYPNDFYVYDPDLDRWDKLREISNKSSYDYDDDYDTDPILGTNRVGFAINGKGYVATGGKTSGTYTWEYDPSTDLWVERYPFEGKAKSRAVGFAIGSLGYVTTGLYSNGYTEDLWSFDPQVIYNKYDK
jgi:N-acetylneuraminic acid mutarotase